MNAMALRFVIFAVWFVSAAVLKVQAQVDPATLIGLPGGSTTFPFQLGFINLSNGNLHIEIPESHVAQRNGVMLQTKLVYDSTFWSIYQSPYAANGSGGTITWSPTIGSTMGWRSVTSLGTGRLLYRASNSSCGNSPQGQVTYDSFEYIDPEGSPHAFTTVPGGAYTTFGPSSFCPNQSTIYEYTADNSGYFLQVVNYGNATVYDMQGNVVYQSVQSANQVPVAYQDTNGNQLIRGSTAVVNDELGRPVTAPSAGYTMQTQKMPVCTNFGPAANQDCESQTFITSLMLPDGTSYGFSYDTGTAPGHYGALTGIKLPTGGMFSFSSSPLEAAASYGTLYPQSITTPDGITTINWNLPSGSGPVVITQPADPVTGNKPQVSYQGNCGGFDKLQVFPNGLGQNTNAACQTTMTTYSGSAGSGALRTIQTNYAATGQITTVQTTLDDGSSYKDAYTYYAAPCPTSGPGASECTANVPVDLVTSKKQYGFDGKLTREIDVQYLSDPAYVNAHIIAKPHIVTVYGPGGAGSTPLSQTTYGYDTTSVSGYSGYKQQAATGATNHDDVDYSPSNAVRGNLTQVQSMVVPGKIITTQTNTYNMLGDIIASQDGNGNSTSYDYADVWSQGTASAVAGPTFAYQTGTSNALGQLSAKVYSGVDGSLAQAQDANDLANARAGTTYAYDALQRPKTIAYPDGGGTAITYTPAANGSPASMTASTVRDGNSSDNIVTSTTMDSLGRTAATASADGSLVTTSYDQMGRVSCVTNPHTSQSKPTDGQTCTTYDVLNRPLKVTEPDGSTTQTMYSGSVTDFYDENQHHWKRQYDVMGQLQSVLEPDDNNTPSIETDYQYDALGNFKQADQWGGARGSAGDRQRIFVYDGLSRLTSSTNPEAGTVGYTYDNNGNIQTKTDARGVKVTYSYDGLNRLLGKTYTDGTLPVHYAYDESSASVHPDGDYGLGASTLANGIGRLTSEYVGNTSPGVARKIFSYDPLGRMLNDRQCWDTLCSQTPLIKDNWHGYDLAGNMVYLNDSASQGQSISYDNAGRIIGIMTEHDGSSQATPLVLSVQYDPVGPMQATLGAGQVETWNRDSRLRISSYQRTNPVNSAQVDYAYAPSYQPNGNVYQATETWQGGGGTWSYGYDNLNRLKSVQQPALSEGCSYGYDPFGNRQSETPAGPAGSQCMSFSANFDANNRITGYCYDASGNLLDDGACPQAGSPHKYAYDGEGRLASVQYGQTHYTYDAEGDRVGTTTSDGTVTNVVFDDVTHQPVAHYLNHETPGQNQDLWFNGEHLGFLVVDASGNQTITWSATDWLGSERLRTDSAGNRVGLYTSLPFGEALTTLAGTDTDAVHFTGKERDRTATDVGSGGSGMDYFGARYYSSAMGRFITPDPSQLDYANPFNPQSLNLYSYAQNNPLSNTDPTGLDCVFIDNDTGSYTGFNSGDCDNSTQAKANSGYYVDGTVSQVSFNSQSQVVGYSASTGDGTFDSFAGSSNGSGAAFNLDPYTQAVSLPGQNVNVNGNVPMGLGTNSGNAYLQIPASGLQQPSNMAQLRAPISNPLVTGDPACYVAPDAVSDIHNNLRGNAQGQPKASTDGPFGKAIHQRTTQGNRSFGNETADTAFGGAFLGLDYAVAVGDCLQGR